jgi:kynureninase
MHMLQSQVLFHGFDPETAIVKLEPKEGEVTLNTADVIDTINKNKDEIALVMMSGVQYYTGQRFDINKITSAARAAGIPVGWDLAHAAGNVPLSLHDDNVDFACWCSYKYLNSGPGGIAGCFVHERHGSHESLASLPRFAGWWGHRASDRFDMNHEFIASPGAQGFMLSNPPVLCVAALRASLEVFDEAGGVNALRRKSLKLTAYLERLLKDFDNDPLLKNKVSIFTPTESSDRGCQLSLFFSVPVSSVSDFLVSRGVICDVRKPSVIRVAPTPLYNSYTDVFDFCTELKSSLLKE